MTSDTAREWRRSPWRAAMWIIAASLLIAPAIAMRFTAEMNWDETDFIVFGVMLAAACGTVELGARASGSLPYRLGVCAAVLTGFLTVWANLAVGMIGSEDNQHNLLFAAVLAVALVGAILFRSRPRAMAWVMVTAAATQLLAGASGLSCDPRGGIFSMLFAVPWLIAAALFGSVRRKA